jgi:hypothetical protein
MPRLILALLAVSLFLGIAKAHDSPTDWIGQERRTNAAGIVCCGKGDCKSFTVDQAKVMADGYHFADGEVVTFNRAVHRSLLLDLPLGRRDEMRVCSARSFVTAAKR